MRHPISTVHLSIPPCKQTKKIHTHPKIYPLSNSSRERNRPNPVREKMGNRKPVETMTKKRKKKGRPSLLELQKRNLRLQKQQQEEQQQQQQSQKQTKTNRNPNPNPNRWSTRRNPNLVEEEEGEEERREKKVKLALRIPNGSDPGESGSDSDGSRKKRRIDDDEVGRQNSETKATAQAPQDCGPATPLPDKKLLVFILDRLQKKDTYAVFSEAVDPEELPDYHEIIENPMDFGTVRKKLDDGAYGSLEEFESDIYLICSNAMIYNSFDTIYFRQARSIQELAKKDFENLRQESDDDEPEQKTARRGRPPIKNVMKRIARGPADRTGSEFSSDATLANAKDGNHNANSAPDLSARKGSPFDRSSMMDTPSRLHRVNGESKSERNEEYSGSLLKGIPMRNWKKFSAIDESRRNTYFQPLQSTRIQEPSILTAFDGEKKSLVPIGLYMECAYARSLVLFAADLGPVGWEIAAKRIQRVVPPGTKFAPGWVGDSETASHRLHSLTPSSRDRLSDSHERVPPNSSVPPSSSASAGSSESVDGVEKSRSPLQFHQNRGMQPYANGLNPKYCLNLPSQTGKMMTTHTRSPEGAVMRHAHLLDMVSRANQTPFGKKDAEEKAAKFVADNSNLNSGPVPPDLNVDFQTPTLPGSGLLGDSKQQQQQKKQQHPDLALQL